MPPAIPEMLWQAYDWMNSQEMSECLPRLAGRVNTRVFRTHPREPKTKTKPGYVAGKVARRHIAAAQIPKAEHIDA